MSRSSDSMGLASGSYPPGHYPPPFVKREQHSALPNMPGNTYELVIGQQPVRARMCGKFVSILTVTNPFLTGFGDKVCALPFRPLVHVSALNQNRIGVPLLLPLVFG